jgi:rhamnosyltransferase
MPNPYGDSCNRVNPQRVHPGKSVCAVVVTFHPDEMFIERIKILSPQVERLLVIDNTPASHGCSLQEATVWDSHIHLIENHKNMGVASALNQGIAYATRFDFKWILAMDQDTICDSDIVDKLIEVYEHCDPKPAVVGSNYHDAQKGRLEVCPDPKQLYYDRRTVITSGSLIDARLASELGGFREDYFIDQVDHEFCLRARSRGFTVVISSKPTMKHSVGTTGGAWLPCLGIMPNHPPLRKYYIARNTLVTLSEYWYEEPEWCLRRIVRLFLGLLLMATLEKQRIAKVGAFILGVVDGVLRHMGPCKRNWLLKRQ